MLLPLTQQKYWIYKPAAYLHKQHIPCVVRAPMHCERLFLHHSASHRFQVYVVAMLGETENTGHNDSRVGNR